MPSIATFATVLSPQQATNRLPSSPSAMLTGALSPLAYSLTSPDGMIAAIQPPAMLDW